MELGAVLAAGCALSLVCMGLFLVGGYMLLRMTGRGLGPIIADLTGQTGAEPEDQPMREGRRVPRRGLKTRAQSLDFDEAVRRYRGDEGDRDEGSAGASRRRRGGIPDVPSLGDESSGRDSGFSTGRRTRDRRRNDDYEIIEGDEY